MTLQPFLLDQWLSQPGVSTVEFHLGGSTGPYWTLRELLALDGDAARDQLLDAAVACISPRVRWCDSQPSCISGRRYHRVDARDSRRAGQFDECF